MPSPIEAVDMFKNCSFVLFCDSADIRSGGDIVRSTNVDVNAANKHGVAVGNTPGVLTETTARRMVEEADQFTREGLHDGWLPHLFVGNLLRAQTVGVIGAGRIGSAYARMTENCTYTSINVFLKRNSKAGDIPVQFIMQFHFEENHLPLDQQRKVCNNEEGKNLK